MNGQMIITLDNSDRRLLAAALADKQRPPAVQDGLWEALCSGRAQHFTLVDFVSIANHCGPDVLAVMGFCARPTPPAPPAGRLDDRPLMRLLAASPGT